MKSIYWRPQKVSRPTLVMISLSAICAWALVHGAHLLGTAEHGSTKMQAASRAEESFQAIRAARLECGDAINRVLDPTDSGLLGVAMSQVTSRPAELADKQTSVNPNFAAAVVEMLLDAGVERGDTVAIGWTGSLPALNIALCAAMESLELIPIAVASVTSSQYGANRPDFLWLDMERILAEQQLISFRSHAASIGGIADRGLGMSAPALEHVTAGIRRNHLPIIGTQSRAESIDQRMQIYTTKAGIKPIKLYVNVGGGVVSTGGSEAKRQYQPGLNRTLPVGVQEVDSVMGRFSRQGIPVIHLGKVRALAQRYGFPYAPKQMPAVGMGRPFHAQAPSRWLAALSLLSILGLMHAFVLTDWGYQMKRQAQFLYQRFRGQEAQAHPPRLAGATSKGPRLMV
jgi:poly-gamma-glutamate system protein